MSNEIVVRVNGWDLVSESGKVEEARIRDLDLAERLQISEPRMIRRLIKKLIDDGDLPGIVQRSYRERYEIKPGVFHEQDATEYLLTEEELLLVATQSKTKVARQITKEVIAVFVALRRGLLSGQDPAAIIAAVRESITSELGGMREETRLLKERVVALDRHPNGLMGDTDAAELRRQMSAVAHMRRELGESGVYLAAYRRVDDAIRREIGYPAEKGAKWELCPSTLGTRAFSRVGMMFHAVSADLAKKKAAEKKAAAEKQIEMFRSLVDA